MHVQLAADGVLYSVYESSMRSFHIWKSKTYVNYNHIIYVAIIIIARNKHDTLEMYNITSVFPL